MGVVWGVVITALALLAWGGQVLSLLVPARAERLGLTESETDVAPAFYADVRGEALWDVFTLWSLLAAGVLLIIDAAAWPYFGLAGGAVYVYFGGRGVLTRREMERRSLPAGSADGLKSAYIMLPVWGVTGLVTLIAAIVELT